MTLREAQLVATRSLESIPELRSQASRDSALLLRHIVGLTPAEMLSYPERVLTEAQERAFFDVVRRRSGCEPIQYITGVQEFFGLPLVVSPAVLIPRPETELLVEAVLGELSATPDRVWRIVDVGTGSGAIALALAHHLPHAEITALEISQEALAIARENANGLGLMDRVRFLISDLLEALPEDEPQWDVIVSNPPYVPESDRASLHPEVREYEPATALFAGEAGLSIYERLIPEAARYLQADGLLALEFGYGQREELATLFASSQAWHSIRFYEDLQGIPRIVVARRSGPPTQP